jgi:hypothetical protein
MKKIDYSTAETSSTKDWLESIKNSTVSAFIELNDSEENSKYTKIDFEHDLKKYALLNSSRSRSQH